MNRRRSSRRNDTGMTLVEVLMVVFIAGLVAGVAVLTLPDRQSPHEKAVQKIRTALQDAQDRAVLTGEVIGLRPLEGRVEVLSWTGVEWQPSAHSRIALPENVRLEIRSKTQRGEDAPRAGDPPFLIFNPLGVTEPVQVDVVQGALIHSLEITADGGVVDAARG